MARPRKVSDEQILESARRCFLEHGPSVSTTVIAERLGVSQAALFKRFKTKEDLLIASLMPTQREPWMQRLVDGPEPGDISRQLVEIGTEQMLFFQRLIPALTMLRASDIDHKAVFAKFEIPPPLRGYMILKEWLKRAKAQGRIRAESPENLAYMILGALQVRPFYSHLTGELMEKKDVEAYVCDVVATLWKSIAPDPND